MDKEVISIDQLYNALKERGINVRLISIDELSNNKHTSFNPLKNTKIDEVNKENNQNFVQTLKELGFEGEDDFYHHIYTVDLTDNDKRRKFELWKLNDGTKKGLMEI